MRLLCRRKWNRTPILLCIRREIASRAPMHTQMTFEIFFTVHFRTLWNRFFDTFLYTATCSQLSLIFEWIVKVKATILRKKLTRIVDASSVGSNWLITVTDSRKRTKFNGKVSDLPGRISSVLKVPLSSINVYGYICNERCYRDLKRLEKTLEDAKSLQQSLQEKFTTNNRTKRCVPSDSRISPSVSAPSKSLRHATD